MSEALDSSLERCAFFYDPARQHGVRPLIAEEGIIPLTAKLVHIRRGGLYGLRIDTPSAAGQHFLLRLYDRVSLQAHAAPPIDAA